MLLFFLMVGCDDKPVNPVYFDTDGDGFTSEFDCDDTNSDIFPDADEICDGLDNDCDGLVDDADDSVMSLLFFQDADGDGVGAEEVYACSLPEGASEVGGDCDDSDASISPDATEECDGIDNDCDELIDDEDDNIVAEQAWYVDNDADGFGDDDSMGYWCAPPPSLITTGGDCDDESTEINPDAIEVCDSIDNDCDGFIDGDDDNIDLTDAQLWYADTDADGQGDGAVSVLDCSAPVGFVDNDLDCDDTNASLNELDLDGDGLSTCSGDCDDSDSLPDVCSECIETNLYSLLGPDIFTATLSTATSWIGDCSEDAGVVVRWQAPYTDTFAFRVASSSLPTLSFLSDCETEESCFAGYAEERFVEQGDVIFVGVQGAYQQDISLSIGVLSEHDCNDGIDEDADGLVDCDDEEDCWYAPSCAMGSCPDYDLIDTSTFLPATHLEGISFDEAQNDTQGSCISDDGNEYSYFWEAPATGCLQLIGKSDSIDLGLYVFEECGGAELHCNDDSSFVTQQFNAQFGSYVELDVVAGSAWIFVVEAESGSGDAELLLELNELVNCDGSPISQ